MNGHSTVLNVCSHSLQEFLLASRAVKVKIFKLKPDGHGKNCPTANAWFKIIIDTVSLNFKQLWQLSSQCN